MIREGRVSVNGEVITEMGTQVEPGAHVIEVDGEPIAGPSKKRSYILNKPPGYICTRKDTHGRQTVFDLLPEEVSKGLHSVGRLDQDAEGLIILTNDGDLTQALTHPSSHVSKTYMVKVKGSVSPRAMKKLRYGVELDGKKTMQAHVSIDRIKGASSNTWLKIILKEGRKNQLKRMCEAVGNPVLAIQRIAIGPIQLTDKLKAGRHRRLSKNELAALKRASRLSSSK
jgi:23S rRNA pseudouridine2605 synthase